MPADCLQTFVLSNGDLEVYGEVSLFQLSAEDSYIKRANDTRVYVEMSNLLVNAAWRENGYGRVLVHLAQQHAQQRGWCIFLRAIPYGDSPIDLMDLIAFYRRCGFRSSTRVGNQQEMIWRPKR